MKDKEKIISIIAPYIAAWGEDEAIADSLVSNNIGDITEWKEQVASLKRILQIPTLPNGKTDLSYFEYNGERISDIVRQRDEYKTELDYWKKIIEIEDKERAQQTKATGEFFRNLKKKCDEYEEQIKIMEEAGRIIQRDLLKVWQDSPTAQKFLPRFWEMALEEAKLSIKNK